MKKTEKYIVFRNQETGAYLVDYKNDGTLAYTAHYIRKIKPAKTMSFEAFEEQKSKIELLAKTMDCEIVVVEATYDVKHVNGEDAKEIEISEETKREEVLSALLNMLGE